jgi:hypothetical protein
MGRLGFAVALTFLVKHLSSTSYYSASTNRDNEPEAGICGFRVFSAFVSRENRSSAGIGGVSPSSGNNLING